MDYTHIAATSTSHRFLEKARSLSASFPMARWSLVCDSSQKMVVVFPLLFWSWGETFNGTWLIA